MIYSQGREQQHSEYTLKTIYLLQNHWANSTKLASNHPWVMQVYSNERLYTLFQGEIVMATSKTLLFKNHGFLGTKHFG